MEGVAVDPFENTKHVVQFYDNDEALITETGCAANAALDRGCAVVCIATDAHLRLLEDHLACRGIDVAAAKVHERIVFLDATGTLAEITVDDLTDVIRFAEVIGSLVDRLVARFPRVWVFGELVALMTAKGNRFGAVKLERLWESVTESRPVFLRCAYPARAFSSERDLAEFLRVCEPRCRVLHSEISLALSSWEPQRMWHES